MITEKLELSDNVHFSITWIPTQPRSSHENEKIGHFHKSLDPAHSWEKSLRAYAQCCSKCESFIKCRLLQNGNMPHLLTSGKYWYALEPPVMVIKYRFSTLPSVCVCVSGCWCLYF